MRCLIPFSALTLFLMVTGCTSFLEKPQLLLKHTAIVGLDSAGVDFEFHLGVTNPNRFDITLLGYTYQLEVMSLPLAAGELQERVLLTSGQETGMRLPVRVSFAELREILKRRPDPERIPYRLNAQLQVETVAGTMAIPFESEGTVSLPEQYRPEYYPDRIKQLLRPRSR